MSGPHGTMFAMSNLLCIDFDFHFPNAFEAGNYDDPAWQLQDWGHSETPMFLSNMVWATRASAYYQHNLPLPGMVIPEGGWEAFWGRFTFTDDAWFGYGDSNAHAGAVTPPDGSGAFDKVVLFDAHHDSGYRIKSFEQYLQQDSFSCEDWMLEHQRRGTTDIEVRFPQWKPDAVQEQLPAGVVSRLTVDDEQPLPDVMFDAVFVCRSGAWVPAWCDGDFGDFLDAAPLVGVQVDEEELDRGFDLDAARAMGEQMREMMVRFNEEAAETSQ
jgi:hypothetical protein